MAPALTQAAEPHNLADAPCHTPEDSRSSGTLYDSLKCLSKCINSSQGIFDSEQILLSNSDCLPSGLAPPAFGWAEGRPVPNTSPCNSNMDEQPPLGLPLSNSGNTRFNSESQLALSNSAADENMGLQSCITNIEAASDLVPKGSEVASTATTISPALDDSNAILSNQNELLALVGWDFNNVNDIIDTLQRFANNPELIDAAARDLATEYVAQNASQSQTPEDRAAHALERLAERQRRLEHRRIFLLRRLQRVTAKGLGVTVSSQLSHLTRHVRSVLEHERAKHPEKERKIEEQIGLDMLHKESMKSMSTSDLISLVRRVEASNNLQRLKEAKTRSEAKDAPLLPESLCTQMESVASEMRVAALTHTAHDSDATESSSGGESCDEAEGFSSINTNYKAIRERAFYRYCRMRGWVASKWMWLQAQIADLDNKIAKQQKMRLDIQKNKGPVQLAEEVLPVKGRPTGRSPAHLDMQDPALTCIGTPTTRTILNGYHPARLEEKGALHGYPSGLETPRGCARTSGIQRVKRRRYVRPSVAVLKRSLGVTSSSTNKMLKVSPVFCKCVSPLTCILCDKSRNNNNTCKNRVISFGNHVLHSKKVGALTLFNQSVEDNLSKVDAAFHPVLSRYSEVLQEELYHTTFKSPEWQTKALSSKPLSQKEDQSMNSGGSVLEPLSKRRRDKNGRRKLARDDGKERIAFLQSRRNLNSEEDCDDIEDELGSWQGMSGSNCSSPCPSPALFDKGSEKGAKVARKQPVVARQKQNSTSNSYDINNIVIPYSMAASSRVELLQYKDIPTPKWRIEEIPPLLSWSRNVHDDEDEEDVSEEAIKGRHSRSEELERKKFLQYLTTQVNSSRSSRSRRADSSGTNTPDHPMSPRPMEPMETSPMATPPGTPLLAPSEDSNHSTSQTSAKSTVLSLSLSSLQSSLLQTNPPDDCASNDTHSLRPQKPPSSVSSQAPTEGGPALRTRRVLSAGAQLRSVSLGEDQSEKDRVSPFPWRDFPLNENDYEDLVLESHCEPPSGASLKGQQLISVPDVAMKMEDSVYTPAGTDIEVCDKFVCMNKI